MSLNYQLHLINRSFDQIATWYHEFMQRAEASFRALHERLEVLERRQVGHGPSDEQVERVLRKILAERFADQNLGKPDEPKEPRYFVKRPNADCSVPTAIPIDATLLQVDPEAVPSNAYRQTIQMLEKELQNFPSTDVSKSALKDGTSSTNNHAEPKEPRHTPTSTGAKPW